MKDKTKVAEASALITQFVERSKNGDLSTDQLLNAIYFVTRERVPEQETKDKLVSALMKYLSSTEDA